MNLRSDAPWRPWTQLSSRRLFMNLRDTGRRIRRGIIYSFHAQNPFTRVKEITRTIHDEHGLSKRYEYLCYSWKNIGMYKRNFHKFTTQTTGMRQRCLISGGKVRYRCEAVNNSG